MNRSSVFSAALAPLRRFAVLAFFVLAAAAGPAAEPVRKAFDIPAGPAGTALRRFAEQAGGQFVFSAEKVAGVRTNALKGEFGAREALQRLVTGTPLRAVQDERTGALTVGRPATSATAPRSILRAPTSATRRAASCATPRTVRS